MAESDAQNELERLEREKPTKVTGQVGFGDAELLFKGVPTGLRVPMVPTGFELSRIIDQEMRETLGMGAEFEQPEGSKPSNPKDIIGSDKLPLHLFPSTAVAMGCLGMMEGLLKYGKTNFRAIGVRYSIYIDAAFRHLKSALEGEDIDPESGIPHLGKALCCIAIIIDAQAAGKLTDDRPIGGGYAKLVEQLTPTVKALRERHKDKNPRHYTIADNPERDL